MQATRIIVSLGVFFLFHSCKPKTLDRTSYLEYIKSDKSGLLKVNEINDWQVSLTYLPVEYFVLTQLSQKQINAHYIDSMKMENDGVRYFLLTIKNKFNKPSLQKDVQSIDEFNSRINQLLTVIPNSFVYESIDDTIPCMMHTFERNYNLLSEQNLILVFEYDRKSKDNDFRIVWNDEIFNFGKLYFHFNAKAINTLPSLNL